MPRRTTTPADLTPTQFMADRILEEREGIGLVEFLRREHAAGLSLEGISQQLVLVTGGDISVGISTIRRWLSGLGVSS